MAYRIVVETCVEDRIKEVLERFAGQRFNYVIITAVGRQYKVDDRWAVLYLLGFQSGLIRMRWRGYIALYIAARATMDYRVAAALHIYSVWNRVAVHPQILIRAVEDSKIFSKIPRAIEDNSWASLIL
jgi:hypothetical protein